MEAQNSMRRHIWQFSESIGREISGVITVDGKLGRILHIGDACSAPNEDEANFHTHIKLSPTGFHPPSLADCLNVLHAALSGSEHTLVHYLFSPEGVYTYHCDPELILEAENADDLYEWRAHLEATFPAVTDISRYMRGVAQLGFHITMTPYEDV